MTDDNLPATRPPDAIQLGSLTASTPAALVQGATTAANELAKLIDSRQLYSMISGRKYVVVEGWLTLATMMGCLPQEESNTRQDDGSYVAVVVLRRMSDGTVLSRASAECGGPEDRTWERRPAYARRSMAATRATGKACRLAFSWVIALAGYATTPAEEMDDIEPGPAPVISDGQRRRLRAKQKASGMPDGTLKVLIGDHGYASSKSIERRSYEAICAQVDAWHATAESDQAATAGETIDHETGAIQIDDDVPF